MAVRKLEGIKGNVQLAEKYEEKRVRSWPVMVDPKLDGVRVIARVTPEEVFFASRNGNEFPALNGHADEVRVFYDHLRLVFPSESPMVMHFDGEAITDLGEFNASAGVLRRHYEEAHNATLMLFDILAYPHWVQRARRDVLISIAEFHSDKLGAVKVLPYEIVLDELGVIDAYTRFIKLGYEGAMVKDLDAFYQFKRTKAWMKVKPKETFECRIVGKFEGQGKYVGMLGGWHCEVLDGNHDICGRVKVGGGFLDPERVEFWDRDDSGRIIEVTAQMKTPDGSLRHPNFLKFRDDL